MLKVSNRAAGGMNVSSLTATGAHNIQVLLRLLQVFSQPAKNVCFRWCCWNFSNKSNKFAGSTVSVPFFFLQWHTAAPVHLTYTLMLYSLSLSVTATVSLC